MSSERSSAGMDMTSALASYGASRKQLRRLAAALKLPSCDDQGSLQALLDADPMQVCKELGNCFDKNKGLQDALRSALDEWRSSGPPPIVADEDEEGTESDAPRPPMDERSECSCVECGAPTPYVFEPLSCRLCETCERRCPGKYQLLTPNLARQAHAFSGSELSSLKSFNVGQWQGLVLKADVDKLAQAVATRTLKNRASAAEWREKSFSVDHRGRRHKWKEWNSATFQRQKQVAKGEMASEDVLSEMFDVSGLRYVGMPAPAVKPG